MMQVGGKKVRIIDASSTQCGCLARIVHVNKATSEVVLVVQRPEGGDYKGEFTYRKDQVEEVKDAAE